ncbi:hypothetical protein [Ekhidna sp.]
MKNSFCGVMILISTFSCNQVSTFETVECIENGNSYMVFKPCRQYIFNAKLWDAEHNQVSESKIWMMANGNPWEYQPESQQEITIQYEFDEEDVDRINNLSINKKLLDWTWVKKTTTGIIENENIIWMHPFRQNQYSFTEVAPFPEVRLPLEHGKTWSGSLNIYEGWGDWANSTLTNYYEVIGYENLELPYRKLEAWHISSYTEASFGSSSHNFWFHPEFGFVKMIIHNYGNQTLEIELIEIIEN